MAHGKNAEQIGHQSKEYWKSRLYRWGEIRGKLTKILTHRKERRINKKIEKDIISNNKEYDEI